MRIRRDALLGLNDIEGKRCCGEPLNCKERHGCHLVEGGGGGITIVFHFMRIDNLQPVGSNNSFVLLFFSVKTNSEQNLYEPMRRYIRQLAALPDRILQCQLFYQFFSQPMHLSPCRTPTPPSQSSAPRLKPQFTLWSNASPNGNNSMLLFCFGDLQLITAVNKWTAD